MKRVLGELNAAEIEEVLGRAVIGRIGCISDGRPYVVPIAFAYEGDCVYGHSVDGKKLWAMRDDPHVCFETECVDSLDVWQSVIASGTFEELGEQDQRAGMQLLVDRLLPLMTDSAAAAEHAGNSARPAASGATVFRIRLTEKTGRYESR